MVSIVSNMRLPELNSSFPSRGNLGLRGGTHEEGGRGWFRCAAGYAPVAGKKGLDDLLLAVPSTPNKGAAVWIYTVEE